MTTPEMIPTAPTEVGDEVHFTRNGTEHRMVRVSSSHLIIHQAHVSPETYEIHIVEDGDFIDVTGINHGVSPTAMGVDWPLLNRLI